MLNDVRVVPVHRTRSGISCLWERGSAFTNTGTAQLVTNPTGKPKRAIFIRTHGDLCNEDHALIPVEAGDCVVSVERHRNQVSIQVEVIATINGETAILERSDKMLSLDAIQTAIAKSKEYHCRKPFYITQLFKKQKMAPAGISITDDAELKFSLEEDDEDEV